MGRRIDVYSGYVELVDHNFTEEDISKFAGISHDSEKGPSIEKLLEWDHLSPFEFASVTFRVKAPIFVARQWMRHRTGKYMEKSLRYCTASPEFYIPYGTPSKKEYFGFYEEAISLYRKLLYRGEPKEQARGVLPVALYTEFYFQMDLRNLINFFKLRLDSSAQEEIRRYAKAMLLLVEDLYPAYGQYVNLLTTF